MDGQSPRTFTKSEALMERARAVVLNGIYGHQSPGLLTAGEYPFFMARGEGCHIWDVDGNEYIDYMCSYGPIVLGHRHPKVEAAAKRQMELGDCQNLPGEVWTELAELLVGITPWADWAVFAKNGSDVTTWGIAVARAFTGRDKVIMAKDSYHGIGAWCTPGQSGITASQRGDMLTFTWNDLDELRRVVAENRGEIAGIILTPFRHEAFHNSEMPNTGFLQGVRDICDEEDMVFVLDDVRAGFRLRLEGSGAYFGVEPDVTCYCKALGNGYAIAAGLGREKLRDAAAAVFFTGSFWTSTVPMAAAKATLEVLRDEGGIERMQAMGKRLRDGLDQQARSLGLKIVQTGPASIPFMTFEGDAIFEKNRVFCGECSRRGVFFHPHHNWFLSAAHTEKDIDQTLNATEQAFKVVKERYSD
jgi:glutamate-1-semialdehyde 2,1-aminomutase